MDAADWMVRALDLQGFRVDNVKGISTDFLFPLLQHGALVGAGRRDELAVGGELRLVDAGGVEEPLCDDSPDGGAILGGIRNCTPAVAKVSARWCSTNSASSSRSFTPILS